MALLEAIRTHGSITQAAKAINMSYKAAWDTIDAMNNASGVPLVVRLTGGRGGGGTSITAHGEKMIETFRLIEREHQRFLSVAGAGIEDFDNWYEVFRRMNVKVSSRNQLFGRVSAITRGSVNDEIEVGLQGEDRIYAIITHESLEQLGLKVGSEVFAMIKASWVMVTTEGPGLRLSARNKLPGTVTRVTAGAVNADVVITLQGGSTVTANVTRESVKELDLKAGTPVCAIFKASSVIVGSSG